MRHSAIYGRLECGWSKKTGTLTFEKTDQTSTGKVCPFFGDLYHLIITNSGFEWEIK